MLLKKSKLYWHFSRRLRKSNIQKGSYSQYGQDLVVAELFSGFEEGTFVDIGANDGSTFSNSLLFEERGWHGICIEPHPSIFKILQGNRSCNLVNCCIAERDGTVDFLVVDGPANMRSGILHSLKPADLKLIDEEIERFGGTKTIKQIESISPKSLLQRFKLERIDFLSIDTEGHGLQILKKFDFKEVEIKVISIENEGTPDIFKYMSENGFELYKTVGCDEIYVNGQRM